MEDGDRSEESFVHHEDYRALETERKSLEHLLLLVRREEEESY